MFSQSSASLEEFRKTKRKQQEKEQEKEKKARNNDASLNQDESQIMEASQLPSNTTESLLSSAPRTSVPSSPHRSFPNSPARPIQSRMDVYMSPKTKVKTNVQNIWDRLSKPSKRQSERKKDQKKRGGNLIDKLIPNRKRKLPMDALDETVASSPSPESTRNGGETESSTNASNDGNNRNLEQDDDANILHPRKKKLQSKLPSRVSGKILSPRKNPLLKLPANAELIDLCDSSDEEVTSHAAPLSQQKQKSIAPYLVPTNSKDSNAAISNNDHAGVHVTKKEMMDSNHGEEKKDGEDVNIEYQQDIANNDNNSSHDSFQTAVEQMNEGENEANLELATSKDIMALLDSKGKIDPTSEICWSCAEDLAEDTIEGVVMKSFIHSHPLLGVATCSFCADLAYRVEDDVQNLLAEQESLQMSSPRIEMELCSWCADPGKEGDTKLACDNCPRVFCDICVLKALGGDELACEKLKSLCQDDGPWKCLYCKSTTTLQAMEAILVERNDDGMDMSDASGSTKDSAALQQLIDQYMYYQQESENINFMLESTGIKKQEESFRAEYPNETDEEIKERMSMWHSKLTDDSFRYQDMIGILQDQLGDNGISMDTFFKEYKLKDPEGKGNDNWLQTAEKALMNRDQEYGYTKGRDIGADGFLGTNPSNYSKDVEDLTSSELAQIEEINTTEETVRHLEDMMNQRNRGPSTGFQSTTTVDASTIRNFQKSIKYEDYELRDRRVTVKKRSEKKDSAIDRVGLRGEREVVKIQGRKKNSSVTVVRRNANLLTRKKRSTNSSSSGKRASTSPKKNSIHTSKSNTVHRPDHEIHETYGDENAMFENSNVVLFQADTTSLLLDSDSPTNISVASPLAEILKPHQVDGIQFMWNTTFDDLATFSAAQTDQANEDSKTEATKGCILAHNMGLGKTLQVVTLIHTLLCHPALRYRKQGTSIKGRMISRILLVIPVNVLENWKNEFAKWIGEDMLGFRIWDFSSSKNKGRRKVAEEWWIEGGVLLVTHSTFAKAATSQKGKDAEFYQKIFQSPGPDCIFIDEGHLMLKTKKTTMYKSLIGMKTTRRVVLTGTPLSNNLFEFYRMSDWISPGCLGPESKFESKYEKNIMSCFNSDSSLEAQDRGTMLLKELFQIVGPFLHRLDSSVLEKDLPFIQQAVIHIHQTPIQKSLHRAFKKHFKSLGKNNFLDQYSKLFPVNNHPGALLLRSQYKKNTVEENSNIAEGCTTIAQQGQNLNNSKSSTKTSKDGDFAVLEFKVEPGQLDVPIQTNSQSSKGVEIIMLDDSDDEDDNEDAVVATVIDNSKTPRRESMESDESEEEKVPWWDKVYKKYPHMGNIESGGKASVLLQILAHAEYIGDKVVVFSQCLKTLDYIESVLQKPKWEDFQHDIQKYCKGGNSFGSWCNGVDYLRIDGQVSASQRGVLVGQFNKEKETHKSTMGSQVELEAEESVKVFLISSKAGSVGINLTAANRVVLFDSGWNPVIEQQAVHRCYRYGQVKRTFVYRLLTENSMEEKVYSRSINKTNLAASVIDQKNPKRNFSSNEISAIMEIDNWVQCETCEKWRMLPGFVEVETLPEKWYCNMNEFDKARSECSAEEKDAKYMFDFFKRKAQHLAEGGTESQLESQAVTATGLSTPIADKNTSSSNENIEFKKKTERDAILIDLLEMRTKTKKGNEKSLVAKHYFHDSLVRDTTTLGSNKKNQSTT